VALLDCVHSFELQNNPNGIAILPSGLIVASTSDIISGDGELLFLRVCGP
jgi:hypothetical protein